MVRTALKVTGVGLKLHHPKGGEAKSEPVVRLFFFFFRQYDFEKFSC
jgi:hypothetical protein